jgi:hypothetical protein
VSVRSVTITVGDYAEIDNISVREIPGNHATQATAASRPTLRQDASGRLYLEFDGIDDSLATAAINFTATDKMTVIAGVHKASDASIGMVVELSANGSANNGAFYMDAPNGAGPSLVFASRGTSLATAIVSSGYAAPLTAVLTGIGDIANDIAKLRYNGSQIASVTTDQGTGAYGNHVMNIGRRNNASAPLHGRIYGLIVRGASTTDSQIVRAERWMAARTGVAL